MIRSDCPAVTISATRLAVAYEHHVALHVPRLHVEGSVIALVGHNGAGKSTFIKTLLRLLVPRSGSLEASLMENGARTLLVPTKHMAFCPETGSVFADISVEAYIKFWCEITHGDRRYYQRAGSKFIERLSIAPLMGRLGRELSKGQRRRVQTAIGFMANPRLYLFDEPFDGLDVQKTSELAELIRDHSEVLSCVLSSHRMDVVERLADTLIVIKQGEIFAAGSLTAVTKELCPRTLVLTHPTQHDRVFELLAGAFPTMLTNRIGDSVRISGSVQKGRVITALQGAGIGGVSITEQPSDLSDAMSYHLLGVELPPEDEQHYDEAVP